MISCFAHLCNVWCVLQSEIQHSKLCFVKDSGDEANKAGSGSSSDSDSNSSSSDGEHQCLF